MIMPPPSNRIWASRRGLRYMLLACISLFGWLASDLELHRAIATELGRPPYKPAGTPVTVPGCASGPPPLPYIPGPLAAPLHPMQSICPAPTTAPAHSLRGNLGSGLDCRFLSPTLDTIICWEVRFD